MKIVRPVVGLLLIMMLVGCASKDDGATPFDANTDKFIREGECPDIDETQSSEAQDDAVVSGMNPYESLNVPTYITKINDKYFIVDCYNNQVIYSDSLDKPLTQWQVMTSDMDRGHTIASDGEVYLIDDTENNRIMVMKESDEGFELTQEFFDIGVRPHFVVYDEDSDSFYAWSSMTGQMYIFRHDRAKKSVFLTEIRQISELDGYYVRSFTIDKNIIYLVSGDGNIYELDKKSFEVREKYPVPVEMYGMVQVTPIDDCFLITISTDGYGNQDYATIICTKDLSKLIDGDYEDIYSNFIGGGTPYCITLIDDYYYLCEHRIPGHSIWQFKVENSEVKNPVSIY